MTLAIAQLGGKEKLLLCTPRAPPKRNDYIEWSSRYLWLTLYLESQPISTTLGAKAQEVADYHVQLLLVFGEQSRSDAAGTTAASVFTAAKRIVEYP